jgi:preprotein translocase subunit SecA
MSEWPAPETTRYPERAEPGFGWRQRLERALLIWPARFRHLWVRRELARLEGGADGSTVPEQLLRDRIRLQGLTTQSLVLWYAWARERGADDDVMEGALALVRGMAVQCDLPESRAGMIAFASAAIALSGHNVHVLTPDDTCTLELEPLLQAHLQCLGLRAAVIESGSPVKQRRMGYQAAVTILSAREALRDYLYDRLQRRPRQGEITRKLGRLVDLDPLQDARMCGLPFGIIVDANRILVDQACEPMTIAGRTDPEQERAWAESALALARDLVEGLHFTVETDQSIRLTGAGEIHLEQCAADLPGIWRNSHRRTADVSLALRALRLDPGHHYRLVDQRVEFRTGTSMPDGMIQLLEAREGIPVSGRTVARGKLTFQRFFRRYDRLAALCTDARYIRDELWRIYGLSSFDVTSASAEPVPDLCLLGKTEKRLVNAVSACSESLGQQCGIALASRRMRSRRKAAEYLRRNLLRHDYQAGNMTAFSGRAE